MEILEKGLYVESNQGCTNCCLRNNNSYSIVYISTDIEIDAIGNKGDGDWINCKHHCGNTVLKGNSIEAKLYVTQYSFVVKEYYHMNRCGEWVSKRVVLYGRYKGQPMVELTINLNSNSLYRYCCKTGCKMKREEIWNGLCAYQS